MKPSRTDWLIAALLVALFFAMVYFAAFLATLVTT